MMFRDPAALLNIQVAFMGIVLVVGLFYLWRMMKGLESKVHKLSVSVSKLQDQLESRGASPLASAHTAMQGGMMDAAAEDAMAQAFMSEVFGSGAPPTFMASFGSPKPASVVVLEEAEIASTTAPIEAEVDHETASVITTSTISKSKVRKMSAETLRDVCKERGLDTEGTRAVLMERVLATLDE